MSQSTAFLQRPSLAPKSPSEGLTLPEVLCVSALALTFIFSLNGAIAAPRDSKPVLHLSKLLVPSTPDSPGEAWEITRSRLRQQWLDVLGPLPEKKPSLNPKILSTEKLAEFKRQHVRYQVENSVETEGYLLTPAKLKGPLPALVVFHATTPFGPRGTVGLESGYPSNKWQAAHFVKQGYVVWCPENYINHGGAHYEANAKKLLAQHPEWTGMTRMTWDAIRAVDFLETLPQVDRARIGCFGHSLGAKEVLYAMAFDERYKVGVFSEGGIGLKFSNWDAPWYLGPKIHSRPFNLEHHQLLALLAPRPFLLIAGDMADDERSRLFIEAARPVYALSGAAGKLQFLDHHEGHTVSAATEQAAEKFLAQTLRP